MDGSMARKHVSGHTHASHIWDAWVLPEMPWDVCVWLEMCFCVISHISIWKHTGYDPHLCISRNIDPNILS
jgi:hypothetical protein